MCYSTARDFVLFFCLISYSLASSYCTFSLLQLQLSRPGVDQDSLSRARGAAQHNLSQQGSVLWDHQWVEVHMQRLLAARVVLVVDLIHNTLEDRMAWYGNLCCT